MNLEEYLKWRAIFRLLGPVEPRGLYLVGIFALLQLAIGVVAARNYALALTFITPSALAIISASGTGDLGVLAGERIADTVLGAAIAMAVLWIGAPMEARRRT
ncbi:MAG: FUSC family protein [Methylovirgula sp.]